MFSTAAQQQQQRQPGNGQQPNQPGQANRPDVQINGRGAPFRGNFTPR
jgi:hypothetical protein